MKDFSEKLKKLPQVPGVYLMKDNKGSVIYVGKAKNLKNRVTSYFRGFKSHTPKTQTLVINIEEFEYIITTTEVEALILEGNLIKKYKPRFNVMLKDDKTYPYIKITNEDFPRVIKVRNIKKDGGKYFGPYTSDYDVNQTIDVIQKVFPIRQCNRDMTKKGQRPCLNYHIKQCLGPCKGNIKKSDYNALVEDITIFLLGKQDALIHSLESKMKLCASRLDFEGAAQVRDQLSSLKKLTIKQRVSHASEIDQDVISAYQIEDKAVVFIFFIRAGLLIGREYFLFNGDEIENESHLIAQFMLQFYGGTAFIPKEILLSHGIDDLALYKNWLSEKSQKKTYIQVPIKGEKKRLVEMVLSNATDYLTKFYEVEKTKLNQLKDLSKALRQTLKLKRDPIRIEAYDISNIMGAFSVGSMVVYENCQKKKSDYRRFKVKTIEGPNDYGSMMEVLYRRFKRGLEAKGGESPYIGFEKFPDLVLIDGGKGHVNAVEDVMLAMGLNVAVVGMVKNDKHRTEALFYKGEKMALDKRSELYKFIYGVQEEVHRFAISYHRSLRDKAMYQSILDDISGIGAVRKANLFKHFKTVEKIQSASLDELLEVEGMNSRSAQSVFSFFRQGGKSSEK